MYWINEVQTRMKRGNQILFAKNSEFLDDLAGLIQVPIARAILRVH